MDRRAFDQFLEHLSRLIRLSRAQRDAIRDELADHIESQFEELTAAGMTPEGAAAAIQDEFGDAAELARRFSRIGQTRRWIMRSALAASLIIATTLATSFLLPVQPGNPFAPTPIAASSTQDRPAAAGMTERPSVVTVGDDSENNAVRAALEKRVPELKFDGESFAAVMDHIRKAAGVNLIVRWGDLEEIGLERDAEVSLNVSNISWRQVLRLLLETLPTDEIGWTIDDGTVIVSTAEDLARRTEVRLYNCSGLLRAELPAEVSRQFGFAFGKLQRYAPETDSFGNPQAGPETEQRAQQSAQVREELAGALLDATIRERVEQLTAVICRTVDPDSWRDNGGASGSISVYDDVLVIVQTPRNHEAVGRLLASLGEVRGPLAQR